MGSSGKQPTSSAGFSRGMKGAEFDLDNVKIPSNLNLSKTLLLQCARNGRPYFRNDFKEPLKDCGIDLEKVVALGTLQFNHLWVITMEDEESKQKLLSAGKLTVKGLRCNVRNLDVQTAVLRIHWLLYEVPWEAVESALWPYGQMKAYSMEKSVEEGFTRCATNVRRVVLQLNEGITIEDIPHELEMGGMRSLVVIHNRAPLCLRCKKSGHIRKNCDTPFCIKCKSFGHDSTDCKGRSFSAVIKETNNVGGDVTDGLQMDIDTDCLTNQELPSGNVNSENTAEVSDISLKSCNEPKTAPCPPPLPPPPHSSTNAVVPVINVASREEGARPAQQLSDPPLPPTRQEGREDSPSGSKQTGFKDAVGRRKRLRPKVNIANVKRKVDLDKQMQTELENKFDVLAKISDDECDITDQASSNQQNEGLEEESSTLFLDLEDHAVTDTSPSLHIGSLPDKAGGHNKDIA